MAAQETFAVSQQAESVPVDPSRYQGLPPRCTNRKILKALDDWASRVGWFGRSQGSLPVPGPNKKWIELLDMIAVEVESFKFPQHLGEALAAWIPRELYGWVTR